MNRQLFELCHVTGNEHKLRDFIKDEIKTSCDECYYDSFGNLIVHLKGDGKKILFSASMDTPGLLVTFVEEDGRLRFSTVGSLDAAGILDKIAVSISGEIAGVIKAPKSTKLENLKVNDLYIDLGGKQPEIKPGDIFTLKNGFLETGNAFFGTALTVKANVSVMVEAIKKLYEMPRSNDLYFAFTVQDGIGFKGSKVAANNIAPEMAVVLSYCNCTESESIQWDGGCVVKIKDSVMISNRGFRDKVTGILTDHQIPFQYEILKSGGATNTNIMYLQEGILTFGISLPCKYHQSQMEAVRKEEIERLQDAVTRIAEGL